MKTTSEIGLKIRAATREFYRYTGISAELERRGLGSSQAHQAWLQQEKCRETERPRAGQASNLHEAHSNQ